MENNQKKQIVGLSRIPAMPLLYTALGFALLSVLLFVAGTLHAGIGKGLGLLDMRIFSVAHVMAAFGFGTLMWAIITRTTNGNPHRFDVWVFLIVMSEVLYHVGTAVAYSTLVPYDLYTMAVVLWWIRMVLGLVLFLDLVTCGEEGLIVLACLILLAYVASSPYKLPDTFGPLQWVVAKLASIAAALQLFFCAKRIYK